MFNHYIIKFAPRFNHKIKTNRVFIGTFGVGSLFSEAIVKSLKNREIIGTVMMPQYEMVRNQLKSKIKL